MVCNTDCKWRKGGKCLLFVGQNYLECKYRTTGKSKNQKKTNSAPAPKKKGK